jgi:hypothetical protein
MSLLRDDQTITLTDAQAAVASPDLAPRIRPKRGWPAGDHKVTITEARDLVDRRRRAAEQPAGAFKREALERILGQTGCVGMRIYYGMHPDGQPALVLVGVDEYGEEMLDGELAERSFPCPPFCPIGPSLRASRI